MVEIIPAILPPKFPDIEAKMSLVHGMVSLVQIDVMDGTLTSGATWPYLTDTPDQVFQDIVAEKQSMPYWELLDFEADLMVKNPEKIIDDWVKAGATRIIVHYKSSPRIKEIIEEFRAKYDGVDSLFSVSIGLAIESDVSIDSLKEIIPLVSFVQCMGIRTIGLQGQAFNTDILKTITSLRATYPELILSVDGGVNFETAPLLAKAGVRRLVSGSAIYNSDDVRMALAKLASAGENAVAVE